MKSEVDIFNLIGVLGQSVGQILLRREFTVFLTVNSLLHFDET